MLLFRSEEAIDAWCARHRRPRGAVVPAAQLHRLAAAWYGDRLDPGRRPRDAAASQAVLAGAGLTGPHWTLS
jgi:hypothetical protein